VDPHPDPHVGIAGPFHRSERSLPFGRGFDRVPCALESDEEGVPLRVDLVPAVRCEGVTQHAIVELENVAELAFQSPDEAR
jgi:hypothetical protein